MRDAMSVFKLGEYEADRKRTDELNAGLSFRKPTPDDKRVYETNCVLYNFEFPHLSEDETTALFNRLDRFFRRNVTTDETLVILGLSTHEKWTPYAEVSGVKGGRPKKIFNHAPSYQRVPHIHLNLLGKYARTLAERVYKNQKRYIDLKSFKNTVFAKKTIRPGYIAWQSDLYRTYGGELSQFIADTDPLDFSS